MVIPSRCGIAVSLLLAVASCAAAWAAEPPAGSTALPGGHRTLADLLGEAEDGATPPAQANPRQPAPRGERPQAIQAPVSGPAAEVNLSALQEAIDRRHQAVDACDLFQTLKDIVREEQKLRALVIDWQSAVVAVNQAADQAAILNAPGTEKVPGEMKAAARRALDQARGWLNRAAHAVRTQQGVLQPLYGRVAPHLAPWVQAYRDMAGFVPVRRSDPGRQAVLAVFEQAIGRRNDFFEGRVLAAFMHAYDGQTAACSEHLAQAITFIDQYAPALYAAHVTHDCASTSILADQAKRVTGFVKMIEDLDPKSQSAHQQWIVASHAVATKREATARTYMQRALAKAGAFKKPPDGKPLPPLPSFLAGDAAHFYLTQKTVGEKDVEKAARLIERAGTETDAWQLARARAALAARQERWADACREMDACLVDCPATLQTAAGAEASAYRDEMAWSR